MTNYIKEEVRSTKSNDNEISYTNDNNNLFVSNNKSLLSQKTNRTNQIPPISDVSMRSVNNRNNSMRSQFSSSMKSLDDIKSEIESQRKKNFKQLDQIKEHSYFENVSDNLNREFEMRKQILVDYYNKKANKLKEVALQIEKEKLKREDNFNNLTKSKNNSFSVKGKEKNKNFSVLKNKELFIEKTATKKEASIEVNKSNITMNTSLFEKKEEPKPTVISSLLPEKNQQSTLFSSPNLFSSSSQNLFTQEKKEGETKPQSSLFSNLTKKEEPKKEENKLTGITFGQNSNGGGLFNSNQTENPKSERKNSTGIFGVNPNPSTIQSSSGPKNLFTSNILDNKPKDAPLFGDKKPEESSKPILTCFNKTDTNKSAVSGEQQKKDMGLFPSNQPSSTQQPQTPIPSSTATIKSISDSNGSLVTQTNPFLQIPQSQTAKIFSSPTKNTATSIFNSNPPGSMGKGNNTGSIFGVNPATTTTNPPSTGLFSSNQPKSDNQKNPSLFSNSIFGNSNPTPQSNNGGGVTGSGFSFGNTSNQNGNQSLFGQTNQGGTSGLFGNTNSNSLFGNNNTNTFSFGVK